MADSENTQANESEVVTEIEETNDDILELEPDAATVDVEMAEEITEDVLDSAVSNGELEEKEVLGAGFDESSTKLGEEVIDEEVAEELTEEVREAVVEDGEEGKETHEGDGEHEDEEDEDEKADKDDPFAHLRNPDPNVMPQVNVAVLARRRWQVKVYPLKPGDFVTGRISSVFKQARESLLYLLSSGRNARGKGEMYLASVNQAADVVRTLMSLAFIHNEINLEIIRKNDDGLVEEKAYLRYDHKLAQLLTVRPPRPKGRPYGAGRKKDRLIGSVFLKNLPQGTSKDILRVMFPFAQEVNYNPEKFKECTARLVLKNRDHVVPCLKAFAKAELGGNVLELHPLVKRKIQRSEDEPEGSNAKQRKKSDNDGGQAKETDKEKSSSSKPSTSQNRSVLNRPKTDAADRNVLVRTRERNRNYRRRVNQAIRKTAASFATPKQDSRPPARRGGNQNRSRGGSTRSYSSNTRNRRDSDRSDGRGDRSSQRRYQNNDRMRQTGYRGMHGSLGVPLALSASDVSLAASAEATKEMVLLQNQLSSAIKNQLAMLNQTTMAVEQAKRGASSVGLSGGGDSFHQPMARSSSQGSGPSRRSIDQYRPATTENNSDRYSHERSRPMSKRGGGNAGRSGSGASGRGGLGGSGNSSNSGWGLGGGGNTGRDSRFGRRDVRVITNSGRQGYSSSAGGLGGGYGGVTNVRGGNDEGNGARNRPRNRRRRTRRSGGGGSMASGGGGGASGGSNYGQGQRSSIGGVSGGYGTTGGNWQDTNNMSFSQYTDPYMSQVDYGYPRSTASYGTSSARSYSQSGFSFL